MCFVHSFGLLFFCSLIDILKPKISQKQHLEIKVDDKSTSEEHVYVCVMGVVPVYGCKEGLS